MFFFISVSSMCVLSHPLHNFLTVILWFSRTWLVQRRRFVYTDIAQFRLPDAAASRFHTEAAG